MPPISMMRSSRESRPVVSVSKMISRIDSLPLPTIAAAGRHRQGAAVQRIGFSPARSARIAATASPRVIQPETSVDDVVGRGALVGVGHLACEDRFEPFGGHAGPGQYALALDGRVGRDDDDAVDTVPAARFEQKRNVEHDDRRAGLAVPVQEASASARTSGWTIASSRASAALSPRTCWPSSTRSTTPSTHRAGKGLLPPAARPCRHKADARSRRNHAPARRLPRTCARWSTCPCRSIR